MNFSINPFTRHLENIDSESAAVIASHIADTVFILDRKGVIEDVIDSQTPGLNDLKGLIGKTWVESATIESTKKIESMLSLKSDEGIQRWRQINLNLPNGNSVPLMFSTIHLIKDDKILAFGRDLSNLAKLQQRLVEAQQAIETDYLKLRFAEARYRQLFDLSTTAHIIIEASSFRILEVNLVAQKMMSEPNKRMQGKTIAEFIDMSDFVKLQDLLNSSRNTNIQKKIELCLAKNSTKVEFRSNFLREDNQTVFLINIVPIDGSATNPESLDQDTQKLISALDVSPDAFVISDSNGKVISGNTTFLKMVGVENRSEITNESLENWLGRGNIDLRIILNNLKDRDSIKHYATTMISSQGNNLDVEISAVKVPSAEGGVIGFSVRSTGSQVNKRNETTSDLRDSAAKLTELVGKVPLRDIVNETTDMIEKLCIMSALDLTMNNRVSASEMLGLSRQSLYIKMRRFNIIDHNPAEDN